MCARRCCIRSSCFCESRGTRCSCERHDIVATELPREVTIMARRPASRAGKLRHACSAGVAGRPSVVSVYWRGSGCIRLGFALHLIMRRGSIRSTMKGRRRLHVEKGVVESLCAQVVRWSVTNGVDCTGRNKVQNSDARNYDFAAFVPLKPIIVVTIIIGIITTFCFTASICAWIKVTSIVLIVHPAS